MPYQPPLHRQEHARGHHARTNRLNAIGGVPGGCRQPARALLQVSFNASRRRTRATPAESGRLKTNGVLAGLEEDGGADMGGTSVFATRAGRAGFLSRARREGGLLSAKVFAPQCFGRFGLPAIDEVKRPPRGPAGHAGWPAAAARCLGTATAMLDVVRSMMGLIPLHACFLSHPLPTPPNQNPIRPARTGCGCKGAVDEQGRGRHGQGHRMGRVYLRRLGASTAAAVASTSSGVSLGPHAGAGWLDVMVRAGVDVGQFGAARIPGPRAA